MEITFESKRFGEVTIRDCMLETNGTNLEEGIEVKVDGELMTENFRYRASSFEDIPDEAREEILDLIL